MSKILPMMFIVLMTAAGSAAAESRLPGPGGSASTSGNEGRSEQKNSIPESSKSNNVYQSSGNAGGSDTAQSGNTEGLTMQCRPSSPDCPIQSSGGSVTTTDSLPPTESANTPGRGGTVSESRYPTSPGTGSMGSGATGAPAGPSAGPTIGTGR